MLHEYGQASRARGSSHRRIERDRCAIARRCATEGAAVAINYITGPEPVQGKDNRAAAQSIVDEIIKGGGAAVAVEADVSDGQGVAR